MNKLSSLKKSYYNYLDRKARHLARNLCKGSKVTPLLLSYTAELYRVAKVEQDFTNGLFKSAYHAPISSDLEFLIARSLYYYSRIKKLGWEISLRKQHKKTAPDIRIALKDKTIGIIEVKAKAGWIQPFFSDERAEKDKLRLKDKTSDFDPDVLILKMKNQLVKYSKVYGISPQQVYLFLPTLSLVHRKKSKRRLKDYQADFVKNSGLQKDNLILLSKNLTLDLAQSCKRKDYQPTFLFENAIKKLASDSMQEG